jgi:NAD(P)H-hydrate epimerase
MIRLTRQQVREVDRLAVEKYHIPGVVLMENAARGATAVALAMLRRDKLRRALILCGGGNNGGDGLAVARHLHNHGIEVAIGLCTDPGHYKGDALINWQIVQAMNLPSFTATPQWIIAHPKGLIIDAIFGTGLTEPPREPFPTIADAAEKSRRPVLAIDLPSGLDCDTGLPLQFCIRATHTITFVAQKIGFANPASRRYTGRITVADIGCPRELIQEVMRHS